MTSLVVNWLDSNLLSKLLHRQQREWLSDLEHQLHSANTSFELIKRLVDGF
jgi:hypothetical protein